MSFSNFNDNLSANNFCDPTKIGIEYENFSNIDGFNFQLPLDSSLNDFNIQKPLKEFESKSKKMTHRDCLNCYKNPFKYSEEETVKSLRHIKKCEDCKKEIKKYKNEDMIDNFSNKSNISNRSNRSNRSNKSNKSSKSIDLLDEIDNLEHEESIDYKIKMIDRINELSLPKSILKKNSIYSDYENEPEEKKIKKTEDNNELKEEIDKNIKENLLKYQNAVLKEKIDNLEKNMNESKENNKKIDKLIKMVNYNINQNNKISNLLGNYLKEKSSKEDVKESNNEVNILTRYNILIYCSIIIIILLVIDIVYRSMYNN